MTDGVNLTFEVLLSLRIQTKKRFYKNRGSPYEPCVIHESFKYSEPPISVLRPSPSHRNTKSRVRDHKLTILN